MQQKPPWCGCRIDWWAAMGLPTQQQHWGQAQGSQSIKVWQINFPVAIRTDLSPSSSPSYLPSSPANATALPAAAHCQPPSLNFKTSALIAATVSYQPSNQSWGSAAIWPPAQRQKNEGAKGVLHCVWFSIPSSCVTFKQRRQSLAPTLCCFSDTESHIRPTSPLWYAAQGKSDFIAS